MLLHPFVCFPIVSLSGFTVFFKYTATPECYTYCHPLPLHDALPIWHGGDRGAHRSSRTRPGAGVRRGGALAGRGRRLARQPALRGWREAADLRRRSSPRSEEHTSELQSLMRISYAVFCLKKQTHKDNTTQTHK